MKMNLLNFPWFHRYVLRSAACMAGGIIGLLGAMFLAGGLVGAQAAFSIAGLVMLAVCAGCQLWQRWQDRLARALRETGCAVQGVVTRVALHRGTKLHTRSFHWADEDAVHPRTVHFRYWFDGAEYRGKSPWYWYDPKLAVGDAVTVFVDRQEPRKYATDAPMEWVDTNGL